MATRLPSADAAAPPIIHRKPRPANATPMANFVGYDGLRVPRRIHSHENTGASTTIIAELTDCHADESNAQPKMRLSVLRSAKSVSVDPACSNTPQNTA